MANIMKFLRIVKIEVIFLVIFQCSTKERKKKGGEIGILLTTLELSI